MAVMKLLIVAAFMFIVASSGLMNGSFVLGVSRPCVWTRCKLILHCQLNIMNSTETDYVQVENIYTCKICNNFVLYIILYNTSMS